MKKSLLFLLLLGSTISYAATWSFAGGFIYFDNSQTQWQDAHIYLAIGKSTYTSVYEMQLSSEPNRYVCPLPHQGWSDAEYMAVIGNSDWRSGNYGYAQLLHATHYTDSYTSGLKATAGQGYLLTPSSAQNGCQLALSWRGDNYGRSFSDEAKNNCQLINATNDSVTIIFSTSSKRFNKPSSEIAKVYAYGSISAWNKEDEAYRLFALSTDGCLYRTFALAELQRRGNSGQPEFLLYVVPTNGNAYTARSYPSWTGGIDERLIFENNGQNMVLLLPGDDITEIAQRKQVAAYIKPLTAFNLNDSAEVAHLTNFRRVPGTAHLYRSYHPYKPDRAQYDTEHARMEKLAELGAKYNIQCDIALSGNETGHVGQTYTCDGKNYTITIPTYYQSIINNDNVLYVGTANGHTPDYNTAVFRTNDTLFGQWMQEVIRFISDASHSAPFQIHCSLGADRTGAFCATLAALCGASWEQIAADYQQTSNLQIQEYRHPNCVRYELYLLTGEWPEVFTPVSPVSQLTLSQAVAKHFIDGGYITQADIDAAVAKLTGKNPSTTLSPLSSPSNQPLKRLTKDGILIGNYDLLGHPLR